MIRYSEAIRLGAMLKPQGFGRRFFPEDSACANEAACLAANVPQIWDFSLSWKKVACPVCESTVENLATIVADHLNDRHRWTREAIADFVATIEAQHSPSEAPEPVEVEAVR